MGTAGKGQWHNCPAKTRQRPQKDPRMESQILSSCKEQIQVRNN
jgi:hypothetical protein